MTAHDMPEPLTDLREPSHPTNGLLRKARKLVVLIIGVTLLLLGAAMLVLPGPGTVVIALGLAVLATEFVWAARLLARVKAKAHDVAEHVRGRSSP